MCPAQVLVEVGSGEPLRLRAEVLELGRLDCGLQLALAIEIGSHLVVLYGGHLFWLVVFGAQTEAATLQVAKLFEFSI